MGAVGQQRHGVIGKAASNLHTHEHSGDDGGPFGAGLGAGMSFAKEDMVAGPDAMVMRPALVCRPVLMVVIMAVPMVVIMGMPMRVPMTVPMTVQCVVVRHDASLALNRRKVP
jgi:hypothetical protein